MTPPSSLSFAATWLITLLSLATACGDVESGEDAAVPSDAGERADAQGASDAGEDADATASVQDAGPRSPLPPGVTELFFDDVIDGVTESRSVILHVPATLDDTRTYPVVLGLHGAGGRNQTWVGALREAVDAGRCIGVYPQGHNRVWNLGGTESTADDVAFIGRVLDAVGSYEGVNFDRTFAIGRSNGAGLAHVLAVRTQRLRGISTIVTQLTVGNEPDETTGTVGVLQILGVEDGLIPYDGGSGPMGLQFYPAEESAELWAAHNACALPGTRETTSEGNLKLSFTGCRGGVEVIHYGIAGAGHNVDNRAEGGLTELSLAFFESLP